MKNTLKAIAISSIALSAANAAADVRNMSGFYAGGNFGYGMSSAKATVNSKNVAAARSVAVNQDLGLKGMRGGLHLGWGKVFQNKLYAGLEASADLSNTDGKSDSTASNANLNMTAKRRNSFGIAARLGGMLGSMLTYVKLGVDTAKWKFSATETNSDALGGVGSSSATKNERLTGFVTGLGMETMITDRVIVGAEWTYTRYRNSSNLDLSRPRSNESLQVKFKPQTNDFRVRVAYKFP